MSQPTSANAALIYQHASPERDKSIADGLTAITAMPNPGPLLHQRTGGSRGGRRPSEDLERSGVPQRPLTSRKRPQDHHGGSRPSTAGLVANRIR
jgi:hypothetical protein